MRLLPSLGNFLNVVHARDVQVTGRVSMGKISSSWPVRATDRWLCFLNHLLYCVDGALLPWKRFFFSFFNSHPATQSFHHLTL